MGHERIGYLPKSKKWRNIVNNVANFATSENTIAEIANQTTKNVISRFTRIESDKGVFAAFKFLILLTFAAKEKNGTKFLNEHGVQLPRNFNLLTLSKSIKEFIQSNSESKEYSHFASQALIETVSEWSKNNRIQQKIVFDSDQNSFAEWRPTSDGKGFCEISRLFFSNFTENYLKYFLEREASSRINNLFDRDTFNKKLEEHVSEISNHAFETSKITQSYSAGWYNAHVKESIPSNEKIRGFISYGFQKINSEIIRGKEFE